MRLVTASESDLEAAVEQGSFRLAFLHRIAGYEMLVVTPGIASSFSTARM